MSGHYYFLTDDERKAVLWALRLGLAYDDGFSYPRDQNREFLRSAQEHLTLRSDRPECICPPDYTDSRCPNCTPGPSVETPS